MGGAHVRYSAVGSLTPFNGRHTKCISELFEHLSLPTDEGGPLLLDAPELAPTLQEYQAAKEVCGGWVLCEAICRGGCC